MQLPQVSSINEREALRAFLGTNTRRPYRQTPAMRSCLTHTAESCCWKLRNDQQDGIGTEHARSRIHIARKIDDRHGHLVRADEARAQQFFAPSAGPYQATTRLESSERPMSTVFARRAMSSLLEAVREQAGQADVPHRLGTHATRLRMHKPKMERNAPMKPKMTSFFMLNAGSSDN